MLCKNPYVKEGKAFGCGQCLPCRHNKARIWTHRIMLEAYQHKENCFLTLTYADDNQINLEPAHATNFIKRLRGYISPGKIRYYLVGEYGSKTQRPHYHLALFGFPTCPRGQTRQPRKEQPMSCCENCNTMFMLWTHGRVDLARLEPASARYIAGYVVKKMTRHDHPDLEGRYPEFARMSLRPGIGHGAVSEIASTLMLNNYDKPDVPKVLMHGRAKMPLGRYLTRELRKQMGMSPDAPPETIKEMEETLQPLRTLSESYAPPGFKKETFKQAIITATEGGRINLEAKMKRQQKKDTI